MHNFVRFIINPSVYAKGLIDADNFQLLTCKI